MKKRLDILVFERGFAESREKAKALIMAGEVFVDNQKADKAGQSYDENANIEFRGKAPKYVSRGGLKLEKAINNFNIDLKDKITMDIGASTGGFTDCMLQNGAKKVYSIDVGYGQLAWKLRTDERVVNLDYSPIKGPEGNIEYLIHLEKSDAPKSFTEVSPTELVKSSHEALDK